MDTGQNNSLFQTQFIQIAHLSTPLFTFDRPSDGQQLAKAHILAAFEKNKGSIFNNHSGLLIGISSKMAAHAVHLGEKHRPYHAYFAAISIIDVLLKRALLAETYPDKKDNNPLLFIHRLYAAFQFNQQLYRVKLTIHDNTRTSDHWRKFYDCALTELNLDKKMPIGSTHIVDDATLPSSLVDRHSITITDLMKGAIRDSDGQPFEHPPTNP